MNLGQNPIGQRVQIIAGSFAGYFAEIVDFVRDVEDTGTLYIRVRFEHSGGYRNYPARLLTLV